MVDEPDAPQAIPEQAIPEPFPPVEVKDETAQEAYAKLGLPRIQSLIPKSQIKAAYPLKNNRVMVICEDGNRIWFTPGEPHGDEELQADYQAFLTRRP